MGGPRVRATGTPSVAVARAAARVADGRRHAGSLDGVSQFRAVAPQPADRRRALHDARAGCRGSELRNTVQGSCVPSSGWLVRTTLEHSGSKDVVPHTGVPASVRDSIPTDGSYGFGRMFFDLRR